jgi:hypothetical protein
MLTGDHDYMPVGKPPLGEPQAAVCLSCGGITDDVVFEQLLELLRDEGVTGVAVYGDGSMVTFDPAALLPRRPVSAREAR